ncbi:MAG: 2-C-methyl-D-erythritol 2,4-cyclodiphosphate synthase [Eubacteriaceae bacterium]|nr:2-C-methyl-D-erythritol 2,4-cyclodiphosphate synthase [Eubacteriaceae bacterium]MDK2905331.1 2-C-methyl-D-erythritol 2,4-cyclodiphosphate synthase [Eubacteriaceae bacterium]MDK2936950.1 2-C-methyl-D-erythritol 2,4-cyclodiphosphate synthase [Eubacteriaceae bacterium]
MIRIGTGYDVHRLVKDRALVLGGVKIKHDLGLLGHSDADVLVHAIMDALLGALALGDIGGHFPDTDPKYKNCDSMLLLKAVAKLVGDQGYVINNIDSTIIAQAPKLKAYINQMVSNIENCLELSPGRVSIKATTEEGLGFSGREEGIAANAVVSLLKGALK